MKFKKLTKEQLLISIDRLTRFKNTKEKYLRVFSDIIISSLIEPVYRKQELLKMPANQLTKLAEEIVNSSIRELYSEDEVEFNKSDNTINLIIESYENSLFFNDEDTRIYLKNSINFSSLVNFIDESCPINLRWLKALVTSSHNNKIFSKAEKFTDNKFLCQLRSENGYKFPIEKVLLVEGITEETLLPAFSKFLSFDFCKEGIQIIPAGGKNQVVKMYYKLITELKIPIFILLDKDAEENISQIKPKLRDIDKIHLVSCGEFEDLLPKSLIIKTVNNELNNFASISESDFDNTLSTAKNLELIFKSKGLHEFKKADFSKLVRDSITEDSDVSNEIASIIMEIGL